MHNDVLGIGASSSVGFLTLQQNYAIVTPVHRGEKHIYVAMTLKLWCV